MSIYGDSLSAIVIGDDLLPIIVIAQNSFGLLITDITFVIYFVIADKLGKIHGVHEVLLQLKKSLFVLFNAAAESVNFSLFLKKLEKLFLQCDLQKKLRQTVVASHMYHLKSRTQIFCFNKPDVIVHCDVLRNSN